MSFVWRTEKGEKWWERMKSGKKRDWFLLAHFCLSRNLTSLQTFLFLLFTQSMLGLVRGSMFQYSQSYTRSCYRERGQNAEVLAMFIGKILTACAV